MGARASKTSSFSARIKRAGLMYVVDVPPEFSRAAGKTSHIPVVVSLGGGVPHRTTLLPQGAGRHLLPLHGEIRRAAGAKLGDRVAIELSLDQAPRTPETPADLARALRDEDALAAFQALAPGRRRQYILWLEKAVHETTREKRIAHLVTVALAAREKAIDRL